MREHDDDQQPERASEADGRIGRRLRDDSRRLVLALDVHLIISRLRARHQLRQCGIVQCGCHALAVHLVRRNAEIVRQKFVRFTNTVRR